MSGPPVRRYPRTIRRNQLREMRAEPERRHRPRMKASSVPLLLVGGFAAAIMLGTLLLSLPVSSASGEWTPFVIALFTATSAVCVTGLVVVDTGTYWSGFGQAVILGLIQFGGLGFMTSATLLYLLFGWHVGVRERLLLSETMDLRMGGILRLVRGAVTFALIAEGIGFVILSLRFLLDYSPDRAVWYGLFHSVSAFNNGGMDVFGGFQGLTQHDDAITLVTIAVLAIVGALGFPIIEDLRARRRSPLALDTKLVLRTTAWLMIAGFVLFLFLEWNGALAGRSIADRVLHAAFQATASRTSGFSSVSTADLADETLLVMMALMFIGGATGSTAGGIKVGTVGILIAATWSAILGRTHVEAEGREIRSVDVGRALSIAVLGILLVFSFSFVLARLEPIELIDLIFEATSAFGTTGLSTGATTELSDTSRLVVSALMFIGRLGPLTLALALLQGSRPERVRRPEERVRIG